MADYLPRFTPGDDITFTASAAVTGGRLVAVTGPYTVAHAPADSAAVVGVACFDAAIGEPVTISIGGVQRLTAASAIVVGTRVASAANGLADDTGTNSIGLALQPAAAANDVIDVLMS